MATKYESEIKTINGKVFSNTPRKDWKIEEFNHGSVRLIHEDLEGVSVKVPESYILSIIKKTTIKKGKIDEFLMFFKRKDGKLFPKIGDKEELIKEAKEIKNEMLKNKSARLIKDYKYKVFFPYFSEELEVKYLGSGIVTSFIENRGNKEVKRNGRIEVYVFYVCRGARHLYYGGRQKGYACY